MPEYGTAQHAKSPNTSLENAWDEKFRLALTTSMSKTARIFSRSGTVLVLHQLIATGDLKLE